MIAAIVEFERRYGHPSAAADWDPARARRRGQLTRAQRFYADGCWPWQTQVIRLFGGWNAAIAAAGCEPTRSGCYDLARAADTRRAEAQAGELTVGVV
ncbi:MAG: hypothetical protein ACR2NR_15610 [Solirubrobacteraceae bacterium]